MEDKRHEFSQAVCERIGCYVYILKDPRTKQTFYVGKGTGNRVFQHVAGALVSPNKSDKLETTRAIHQEGLKVEHYILRHGLSSEQAHEIESASIDLLGLENLTNEVKGHDTWERGLKTVDEVVQHYDAKAIEVTEPSVIININKRYRRFMSPQELYDTTRSSWVIGIKRNKAQYAFASYRGLVREIYVIENWTKNGDRWEFHGKVADSPVREKYINQSLEKYIKKGGQNPIRYTF